MASDALRTVIEMLRTNNPVQGETIAEMRANMEATLGAMPPPEGVDFEPVDAGGVPAEWTRAEGAGKDRAVVYFHGGGYCIGSLASHRMHVANLSRSAGLTVLSVDYRLAPEHPHPAAVEDALAAYGFALESGLAPERIALAGDSAGGGLTLAALLAIRERGLPMPGAGVGISPWTDLAFGGESIESRADLDPLVDVDGLRIMADAYLAGADPRSPLVSPLHGELAGLPPLLLQVGSAEILLDDATRFADRARRAGVDVDLRIWEDMIHVWHAFAPILPEGQQAVDEIADFLAKRLG